VDYNIARVKYNPDGCDQREKVELFAKRKSQDWQYEQEYRLIVDLDHTHRQVIDGQAMFFMDVKPAFLKSVTIGLRASEATRSEIMSLTDKAPLNHLHIFQIQVDPNEFKLHRIRIK
jgi:hypothetical protein